MDVLRIYDAMPSRRPPPPSAGFRAMSPKAAQSNNPYHKVGVAGAGRVAFDKFESHNQGTAPVAESMAATRMLTVKTRTGFVKRAPVKVVASAAVAMPATTNAATVMAGSITWARTWSPPTCEQGHVTASQSSQAFKAGFQKQVPSTSAEHARYSPNRPILTLDAYSSTVKAPSVQPWKPEQPVIAEGGMPVITEYDVPNGRIKPHLDGGHTRIIDGKTPHDRRQWYLKNERMQEEKRWAQKVRRRLERGIATYRSDPASSTRSEPWRPYMRPASATTMAYLEKASSVGSSRPVTPASGPSTLVLVHARAPGARAAARAATGAAAASPAVVSPAVADPAIAEPAVVSPAIADPAVADLAVAEPTVVSSAVAEPAVHDPAVADPAVAAAQAAAPDVATPADHEIIDTTSPASMPVLPAPPLPPPPPPPPLSDADSMEPMSLEACDQPDLAPPKKVPPKVPRLVIVSPWLPLKVPLQRPPCIVASLAVDFKGEVRRSIEIAPRTIRPAAQIRAAVNRLSVAAVKTSGDEQVRKLRLECKQPLETLMRLQHVVLNFGGSSTSEEALKLPQGGSEVLAAVNGTIECVGELLPGWKPTPEQCYDDAAFVARVLRRRMRLDLPECWLRIDPRTHGSPLQVQLKAMGIFLDLHVRPSAMTPLVYCCSPETRLRVISPKNPPDGHTSSLRGRVSKRVGTVERVREDGVAVIRFDGDSEGTSMDLRSPLRVFEENPPIERKIATASPTTGLAMNAAAVFLQRQFRRRMGPRLVREKEQEQAAGIIGRACRKANSNKKKKWEDELAKKREDQLAAFEAQTREVAARRIQEIHRYLLAPRVERRNSERRAALQGQQGILRQLTVQIEAWVGGGGPSNQQESPGEESPELVQRGLE